MYKVTDIEKLHIKAGERGVIPCPLRQFLECLENDGFDVDWAQFIAEFTAWNRRANPIDPVI